MKRQWRQQGWGCGRLFSRFGLLALAVWHLATVDSFAPSLTYSSCFPGNIDHPGGIRIDTNNNIYIAGNAHNVGLPTLNCYRACQGPGSYDYYVAKFDPNATSVLYGSYIGGPDWEYFGDMDVDPSGNIYIIGQTSGTNFPTRYAFQKTNCTPGWCDFAIVKIDPTRVGTNQLVYSTYLGGSLWDYDYMGIKADNSGNAYFTGRVVSGDIPIVNAYQTATNMGAYMGKLSPTGVLVWSTYLGPGFSGNPADITVDANSNVYVVGGGWCYSVVYKNSFQTGSGGGTYGDAFIVKMNPSLVGTNQLLYSSLIGGDDNDYSFNVDCDDNGNAWVCGLAWSRTFPTKNAAQPRQGGGTGDSFLARFDTTKTGNASLVFSTYWGGSDNDGDYWGNPFQRHTGVAIDKQSNAYIVGMTESFNFPTRYALVKSHQSGTTDMFVAKFSPSGSNIYSTYYGGTNLDSLYYFWETIAVDSRGSAWILGFSNSTNFPVTTNAYNRTLPRWFFAKIEDPLPLCAPLITATSVVTRGGTTTNLNAFRVWNAGDGTLVYNFASNASWATASSDGQCTVETDAVRVVYGTFGVAPGIYTAQVTVVGSGLNVGLMSNGAPAMANPIRPSTQQMANVVLQVNPGGPDLMVSPTNLYREVVSGTNAGSQPFEVWNSYGYYPMSYTIGTNVNWMSVSPVSGISGGEHDGITVSYNTAGLSAGVYTGLVTVTSPHVLNTQVVSVVVRVDKAGGLGVSPMLLTNMVTEGHELGGQSFEVWNGSGEPAGLMTFSVTTNKNWLRADPVMGTSTGEHRQVSVGYGVSGLSPSNYTGLVSVVSGLATNSPQDVSVVVRVNAKPSIGVSVGGYTNEISEGHDVSGGSFEVWNGSGEPKGQLVYALRESLGWLGLSSTNGTSLGEHQTVQVSYNTAGLSPGVYEGAVEVAGTDGLSGDGVASKNLGMKVTVRALPTVRTSVEGLTNVVMQDHAGGSQSFEVWNGSSEPKGTMRYRLEEAISWASVDVSSGTSTGERDRITVSYDTTGKSAGVYEGVIRVIGEDVSSGDTARGSPVEVRLVMQVESRQPVNMEAPRIEGLVYVGQEVRAIPGVWTKGGQLRYEYQWQRAESIEGEGLVNIAGAVSSNYVVGLGDRGKYLRVRVTGVEDSAEPEMRAVAYSAFAVGAKVKAARSDYDGDGRGDVWWYEAPLGMWRMKYSGGGEGRSQFGWSAAMPVEGDYDGDGVMDLAVYYPAGGLWYLMMSGGEYRVEQFGWWAAQAVSGDFDGDGISDLAVYYPAGGMWHILGSAGAYTARQFGWSAALPVAGDYDGDGVTDLGVYYPAGGLWYFLGSEGLFWAIQFGWSAALPAAGDYDGDGISDVAVYYQAGNVWYILTSTGEFRVVGPFGTSAGRGIPAPADYDGDGKCDPATVHVSGDFLVWCIQQSRDGYTGHSYQLSTGMWR